MNSLIKQRCFKLEQHIESDKHAGAISQLQQYPGVLEVSYCKNRITVSYESDICNYSGIRSKIGELLPMREDSGITRFLTLLITFMENNEYEHRNSPAGWDHAVQSLYLSMHDKRQDY